MSNFITHQGFLISSYTFEPKELEKIDKYLLLLEKSGISRYFENQKKEEKGGRPAINPCDLMATILYCFAFGKGSLRDIEDKAKYDLRVIYLMNNEQPSYKTFGNFINETILPNRWEIYSKITKQIFEECSLNMDTVYIDGSKFEADSNKYKFVWKPTKHHERLSNKIEDLLKTYGLERGVSSKGTITAEQIARKITEFNTTLKPEEGTKAYKDYLQLIEYLKKSLEYEEKERICGPNRNSYFKTDHDATAMCLKEDYYSGLGSNMHAAYNTQIVVSNGMISGIYLSQSRHDGADFIPTLEKYKEMYNELPKKVCADAGYGSFENYRYLEENNIENYVKHFTWEGNVSGRYPSQYRINKDKTITCVGGKIGEITGDSPWHPRKKDSVFYKVDGCNSCAFGTYCKRFMKDKSENYKYFEVVQKMQEYIQQSEENLLSVEGIEMRVNRSSQVEGAYGVIKQDLQYERFRRTSLTKVETEFMLVCLGYNIRKLFRYYAGKSHFEYWKAPDNLSAESLKKPSAKRLENRVNRKKNKSPNQVAKDNYHK